MSSSFEVAVQTPEQLVTPKEAVSSSALYLHNLEQQVPLHLELLFIYAPHGQQQQGQEQDRQGLLRDALAELLVPYNFVAGRYQLNEEEDRLEINCNSAGVPFLAAKANTSIKQLGDLSVPNADFTKLVLYPKNDGSIEDIPILTLQVTDFTCGGFVLGICISHVLLDGVAIATFLQDYASLARGGSRSNIFVNPDRTFLKARSPPKVSYDHPEIVGLPVIPAKIFLKPGSQISQPIPSGWVYKTFNFTAKMLNNLKQKAMVESTSFKPCSSFEALSAKIWQARTKALNLESEEKPAKLFIIADLRKHFKSSIPSGFSGNAIIAAPCTSVSGAQVCNNSLSFCVEQVQQTIRSATEDYVRSQADLCETNHGVLNLPGGLIITSWARLGFQDIDFGWGKPAYISPVVSNRVEYVILLPTCRGDGAIDACIAMPFERMNDFERYLLQEL